MPVFPCASVPEGAEARLVGLYPQRQPGLWMQRLRVPGGDLGASQWSALASMARRFTPGTALHLTTRQDVEFHNLAPESVPPLQSALADAGLTCLGTCGDTVRNVTVCPGSGLGAEGPDLSSLAREVLKLLQSQDGVFALPRKFKVSFSGCAKACGQPFINDLGFIAKSAPGGWTFDVIGAGSLGPRPATGIALVEGLAPKDALPLTLGALRLFAGHGDRKQRGRARLRHVRERLGDGEFKKLLTASFEAAKRERSWPVVELSVPGNAFPAHLVLRFINGDLSPEAAEALASLAGQARVRVRIGNHHEVFLAGEDEAALRNLVTGSVLAKPASRRLKIVACPGTRWCSRGLTDASGLAARIDEELGEALPAGALVSLSACPNGCAHSAVAGFGLTGGLAKRDGKKVEVWTLGTGGGRGRTNVLAQEAASGLRPDDVIRELRARATQSP